jgi:hypothetical protein
MSTDPKSPKPVPSVAELNAYLEKSAARTKLRLPLAKGAALPLATGSGLVDRPLVSDAAGVANAPTEKSASRALPVQGKKPLRTQASPAAAAPRKVPPGAAPEGPAGEGEGEASAPGPGAWSPFPTNDER